MRKPSFDIKAPKSTVSLTLNSDLYAKAKMLGINASKVAEDAIAHAYEEKRAAAIRIEIEQDLSALKEFTERHGSFADLVRAHYEQENDAV